jgi:histidinol phosphatase-like PHP family hydrolase
MWPLQLRAGLRLQGRACFHSRTDQTVAGGFLTVFGGNIQTEQTSSFLIISKPKQAMFKQILLTTFLCFACFFSLKAAELPFVPKKTEKLLQLLEYCKDREIPVIDFHIHLRGGMTAEKAAIREEQTGIRSGVLENIGRRWPMSNNDDLRAFIDNAEKARANGHPLPIGIQVNDRDWFEVIDPELKNRLDYVLADTMIMGVDRQGLPQQLWAENLKIDDPEKWMERYMEHNLQILSEPITILANPTYLPKGIEHLYDQLWTEERMKTLISKAIDKNVALEIQATSSFPTLKFFQLAKEMGAKFSLGTNNHDDKPLNMDRWLEVIKQLDLKKDDFLDLSSKRK